MVSTTTCFDSSGISRSEMRALPIVAKTCSLLCSDSVDLPN